MRALLAGCETLQLYRRPPLRQIPGKIARFETSASASRGLSVFNCGAGFLSSPGRSVCGSSASQRLLPRNFLNLRYAQAAPRTIPSPPHPRPPQYPARASGPHPRSAKATARCRTPCASPARSAAARANRSPGTPPAIRSREYSRRLASIGSSRRAAPMPIET